MATALDSVSTLFHRWRTPKDPNVSTLLDVSTPHDQVIVTEPISYDSAISEEVAEDRNTGVGAHSVLKNTDYWFNVELSQLERAAREFATEHAHAGLPRMDVPLDQELPVEIILRERATRVFFDWSERVKRKMQGAVDVAIKDAWADIHQLRQAGEVKDHLQQKIKDTKSELAARHSESGKHRSVGYGRLLKRWKYYAVVALLVLVDWVANLQVFKLLMPPDPSGDLAANAPRFSGPEWAHGFSNLFNEISLRPDIALLALGVVVFLMLLGHFIGSSARRLIAFRSKDETTRLTGFKSHGRQTLLPLLLGSVGIFLVVSFLYTARKELRKPADEAYMQAEARKAGLIATRDHQRGAGDIQSAEETRQKIDAEDDEVSDLLRNKRYADSISDMSNSILMLNLTLVVVAIVAAYLESSAEVADARMVDPAIDNLDKLLMTAETDLLVNRERITRLCTDIEGHIHRGHSLCRVRPLRDWEAKARRLEAVIPLFRTDNARLRGIDVQNIEAFKKSSRPLDLPIVADMALEIPENLEKCELEYLDLRLQMFSSGVRP